MTWIADQARFMLSFVKAPFRVGAIMPSSRYLARRIVGDMQIQDAKTIVEVGAGTGPFTHVILEEKRPETYFMAIELDTSLAETLRRRFPGAHIINDSAEFIGRHLAEAGKTQADTVISSLPWAGFSPELQRTLLAAIAASIPTGGRFSTFTYLHASWLRAAHRFRDLLGSTFSTVTTTRVVWRNFPPAFAYRCTK